MNASENEKEIKLNPPQLQFHVTALAESAINSGHSTPADVIAILETTKLSIFMQMMALQKARSKPLVQVITGPLHPNIKG